MVRGIEHDFFEGMKGTKYPTTSINELLCPKNSPTTSGKVVRWSKRSTEGSDRKSVRRKRYKVLDGIQLVIYVKEKCY